MRHNNLAATFQYLLLSCHMVQSILDDTPELCDSSNIPVMFSFVYHHDSERKSLFYFHFFCALLKWELITFWTKQRKVEKAMHHFSWTPKTKSVFMFERDLLLVNKWSSMSLSFLPIQISYSYLRIRKLIQASFLCYI